MDFLEKLKIYTKEALELLSNSFDFLKDIDFPVDFLLEEKIDKLTGQVYMYVTYKIIDEEYAEEVYEDIENMITEIQTILNGINTEAGKKLKEIINKVTYLLEKINLLER